MSKQSEHVDEAASSAADLDTLIIGGGLAGLSLAQRLGRAGISYRVIEARHRLGGRILSHRPPGHPRTQSVDLGPAWFWAGQDRIARLVDELGLEVFEQYATGELSYEDERGRVERGRGFSSMEGSYRLVGGFGLMVDRLAQGLPGDAIVTGCSAQKIALTPEGVHTHVSQGGSAASTIVSRRVALALPPRVAAASIDFGDAIASKQLQAMDSIPTWMAGHAKLVAVYSRPFWREAGLSGDAMSRRGPLAEIHDASPSHGGPYALFGFVGVAASARVDADALLAQAQAQLVRIFGPQANDPLELVLQDWAGQGETATRLDQQPLREHPRYGLPARLAGLGDGRIVLASTEVAPTFGGYLEGALEAAELVAEQIKAAKGVAGQAIGRD